MARTVRKPPSDYEAGELSYPVNAKSGEGLADLLYRATAENGYLSPAPVLGLIGLGPEARLTHGALAGQAIDAARVAFVLGLPSANEIERLEYRATRTAETHYNFFGREVRGHAFFKSYRMVSPLSLRRDCYQKAIWSVRGITFDPTTRETLLFHCPVCTKPLTFFRSYGIEYCAACYERGDVVDLREFVQPIVEVEDEEALRLPLDLVDPELDVQDIDLTSVPEPIREFGPGAIFELISNIARLWNFFQIDGSPSRDALLRHQTPYPEDMAKAARSIMSWPEGLNELHDKMLYNQKIKQLRTHAKERYRPPLSQILSLLDDRLRKIILSKFQEEKRRVACRSLALITSKPGDQGPKLKLSRGFWGRNHRSGLKAVNTVAYLSQSGASTIGSFDARFLMLRSSQQTRIFAKQSGIPICLLPDLFAGNFIEILDNAVDPYLERCGEPPKESLEERFRALSSRRDLPSSSMSLADAVSTLSGRRINPFPAVFDAIFGGTLEVWLAEGKGVLIHRLRVADFDRLRELLRVARIVEELSELPADNRTACVILGLRREMLLRMHHVHLLQPDLTIGNVWLFHDKFILGPEILRRGSIATGVGMHHHSIAKELKLGALGKREIVAHERGSVEKHYGDRLAWRA
ncbi:hypothetical protein AB4Z25_28725 [Rhizobium sp. RAF36]|uniref:hypothetical protein n=1 Tax=Rhizobium sp. RAF36 TaxID=3233055 RepID=UPI003F9732D7